MDKIYKDKKNKVKELYENKKITKMMYEIIIDLIDNIHKKERE